MDKDTQSTMKASATERCDTADDILRLNFHFPPLESLTKIGNFEQYRQELREIQEEKLPNYISTINHTLDSHVGCQVLKELRVHMPCMEGANIERWLEFALAREVEIIDIHMVYLLNARHGYYTLELSNLITKNGGQSLLGLKCLKELSLSIVHVDDREIELLLSNFPLLESLSIADSERLKTVLISGHSVLKLKYLDISYAENLESIEIVDMINLVSLRCYGLPPTYVLRLNNIPKLTEFNPSDQWNNSIADVLSGVPSCICDQLLVLKLWTNSLYLWDCSRTDKLPELINIKHLELEVCMHSTGQTLQLFHLIEACRSLEKLEIKFLWGLFDTKRKHTEIFILCPTKNLSPNLKKLKLSGYLGCSGELELALFVMKNVVALEEVIVEPCDQTQKIRERATARAWRHFGSTTPNSVNLVIT